MFLETDKKLTISSLHPDDDWPGAANFIATQPMTPHSPTLPPPCRARVASLPCWSHGCSLLLVLSAQTTAGPVERPAHRHWKGPRIHKLHNFSSVSRSDRFSTATVAPPTKRLRLGNLWKGARSLCTSAPLWFARAGPPALIAAGFHRARRANGGGNEDAPPRHDNTQQRVQLSLNELVQDRQKTKTEVHWRPRDHSRCHCWHGLTYSGGSFKEACLIFNNKYPRTCDVSFMASHAFMSTRAETTSRKRTLGQP